MINLDFEREIRERRDRRRRKYRQIQSDYDKAQNFESDKGKGK